MITGSITADIIIIMILMLIIPIPFVGFLSIFLVILVEDPSTMIVIIVGIGIHVMLAISIVVMITHYFSKEDSIFKTMFIVMIAQNVIVGAMLIIWFWILVLGIFGILTAAPAGTALVIVSVYYEKRKSNCKCTGQEDCACKL